MPKRKTTNKKASKQANGIYMPYKKQSSKTYPKRKKNIFKPQNKGNKRRKRVNKKNISGILLLGVSIIIVSALLFLSIKYIRNMRNTDVEYEESFVIGLQDIPAYPNSEFIFENSLEDSSISNFLSNENSAYRLPPNTNIEKVFEFYKERLPEKGWTYLLSVPIQSDDKEYGEYWLKEDSGLRIYSKYNDIWYESLTKEEAENGLAERVKEEIERDMMLIGSDTQEFLPDYPWLLNIPKEYLVSYTSSEMGSLRTAQIKKVDGSETIRITPIGYTGAKALDFFLDDYVNTFDQENTGVNNTVVISKPGIRGTIRVGGEIHLIAVLPCAYNDVAYVIDSSKGESPFFEYLLENITAQDPLKY